MFSHLTRVQVHEAEHLAAVVHLGAHLLELAAQDLAGGGKERGLSMLVQALFWLHPLAGRHYRLVWAGWFCNR